MRKFIVGLLVAAAAAWYFKDSDKLRAVTSRWKGKAKQIGDSVKTAGQELAEKARDGE